MNGHYRITEPHPTPVTNTIFSGRGGFGNVTRVHKDVSSLTHGPTASGPPSLTRLSSASSTSSTSSSASSSKVKNRYYLSGRGGAGNAISSSKERAIFSFDEELAAQSRMMDAAAPVYHVGRGGAGNAVVDDRAADMSSWGGSGASSAGSSTWSVENEKQQPQQQQQKAKRAIVPAWMKMSKTSTR